jgi:hypothetical protein
MRINVRVLLGHLVSMPNADSATPTAASASRSLNTKRGCTALDAGARRALVDGQGVVMADGASGFFTALSQGPSVVRLDELAAP